MVRKLRPWLSIAVVLATVLKAPAQSVSPPSSISPHHFEAQNLGQRVSLGPDWLFSADDNPANASKSCDDGGWRIVTSSRPLLAYGIRDLSHAWYRMHVHVSHDARSLAVETQSLAGSYELYVNGVRIGANGRIDNPIESSQKYLTFYEIPDSLILANEDLIIALRFGFNRMGPSGIGTSTPLSNGAIFLAPRDAAIRDASFDQTHRAAIPIVLCTLSLIVGFVALALYLAMRSRPEYLAIAISLIAEGLQAATIGWAQLHIFTFRGDLAEQFWLGISNVALIEFVRLILGIRATRWLLALELANFLGYFAAALNNMGYLQILPTVIAYFIPALMVKAVLIALLSHGALRHNNDARLILPPVAVISVANYWYALFVVSNTWSWRLHFPNLPGLQFATYRTDFWDVWNAIYCITMLLFVVLRTIGIARERARAAAELEAARVVQQVLIPQEIPKVPGFALQSVYSPAGEVGGDFFQISPITTGGVLVVIGDVSGKGMPAAMTVSLLVGTFRTLAHFTQSPAEILAAMNTRMLGRSYGGFTTCLVLRADPDGTITVANAGHIAPYVAGKELQLENRLPLGLAAATDYVETTFHLTPGEQLTLVTDGVVEARDKTGALFGFDRTASLSLEPAAVIAQAARTFGQEDDITALTLTATSRPMMSPA